MKGAIMRKVALVIVAAILISFALSRFSESERIQRWMQQDEDNIRRYVEEASRREGIKIDPDANRKFRDQAEKSELKAVLCMAPIEPEDEKAEDSESPK